MSEFTIRGKTKTKDEIKREYKEIIKIHKSNLHSNQYDELANVDKNIEKNRYEDVIPLKESSVRLKRIGSDPLSEYINANFVQDVERDGFLTQIYISAQAPLPSTFPDFWRMVWEYNVPAILMLTNLIEDNSIKAEIYWPRTIGKAVKYGDVVVLSKKEEIKSSSLIIRYYNIWQTNDIINGNNEKINYVGSKEEKKKKRKLLTILRILMSLKWEVLLLLR